MKYRLVKAFAIAQLQNTRKPGEKSGSHLSVHNISTDDEEWWLLANVAWGGWFKIVSRSFAEHVFSFHIIEKLMSRISANRDKGELIALFEYSILFNYSLWRFLFSSIIFALECQWINLLAMSLWWTLVDLFVFVFTTFLRFLSFYILLGCIIKAFGERPGVMNIHRSILSFVVWNNCPSSFPLSFSERASVSFLKCSSHWFGSYFS